MGVFVLHRHLELERKGQYTDCSCTGSSLQSDVSCASLSWSRHPRPCLPPPGLHLLPALLLAWPSQGLRAPRRCCRRYWRLLQAGAPPRPRPRPARPASAPASPRALSRRAPCSRNGDPANVSLVATRTADTRRRRRLPPFSTAANGPVPWAPHLRRAASLESLPGSAPPPSAARQAVWCCALPAASPSPVRRVQACARRSTGGCSGWGKKEARRNSSERSPLQAPEQRNGW